MLLRGNVFQAFLNQFQHGDCLTSQSRACPTRQEAFFVSLPLEEHKMVHKMKTFCCGCTLQTGTIVIGVLAAVTAVCDGTNLGSQEYLVSLSNFWFVLVVNLIVDVARLATSLVMIRGASSGSARLVRPWYVLHLVLLAVFIVHSLILFFYAVTNHDVSSAFGEIALRIALASIYGFGVYTVHCYHQQLVESQGNLEKVLEATQPPQIFVTSEKEDFNFRRL